MASFYVIRGKDNGQHFPIRGALANIGREASNQIRLYDTEVSRIHARILKKDENQHEILDVGSSNGTYVNSRRITRQVLQSGDRVQVGRTLLIYTGGPEPHSTRSRDDVEIVTNRQMSELSQIRSSLESLNSHVLPSGSPIDELQPSSSSSGADRSPGSPAALQLSSADWEIVYQVGQAISRTGDLDDLLTQVLELIFQWIACDRGCIMMLDDVTGLLTPTYSRQRERPRERKTSPARKMTISRTILDHVVESKEGVLTSNAQDDSRWDNVESIARLGVHEAICVPMLGRYGTVGAIYVDTEMSAGVYAERQGKSCFDEQHLKLMMAIAGQAALAIEDTQFYRAMLQSERLATMGQTIANLSHHVKNILQGVRGGSYLVEDGLKKEDLAVIQKGWSIVERNQERISNLVMDMLSFSKDREPEIQRCDLRQVIDDAVELMLVRAQDHQVQLIWQSPATPLEVDMDSEAMHRAILNVVTNAIDAVSQFERVDQAPGQVTISTELSASQDQVCVHVEDNGAGIAEDELARIFSPFESNKGARGTGLGLPVSQKVLREHGGDILVHSQPGSGTRFTLTWPPYHAACRREDDWGNRKTVS
ncbi:MAG: FHA domain-containing protein [Planctomycetales bacterium]|nr:FHA domain-containing protein [Planctomycetales bacterium]